ncbi:MAG: hypothetical protein EWV49_21355 [Microcystis aeruginosa Ma_QC_Ch_20071001_S25]|uniref:Uncharacterized protein n=1 Tax=Microcystis aeruginosa Ma_QC_Ch_20071001_S25D TaxID=2486250 RepID=A0A552FN25_MICAE|nr:MAG: hypothetical protein EWV49_21355 [Microcystis aeruginosa Ma_QC_Ch_20071001_S25]TRU48126.1 MAG: hypothetical protein EWV57_15075 [Microcystis aeruginosa Ma_QC_Ch_20071001_S25D]TRU67267.1 MAG: hypothetical protein EWV90_00785 [Microcystis aeruginosa Ma_QC_Ch_20071001_M135]
MSDTPLIKGGLRGDQGRTIFNLIITSYFIKDNQDDILTAVKRTVRMSTRSNHSSLWFLVW